MSKRAVSGRPARPLPREASERPSGIVTDGQDADLNAYIARLIDAAPPLTAAQRDMLALLLRRPRGR